MLPTKMVVEQFFFGVNRSIRCGKWVQHLLFFIGFQRHNIVIQNTGKTVRQSVKKRHTFMVI
jgi:hypothetical protein